MNTEIERKFRVHEDLWKAVSKPVGNPISQAYLHRSDERVVRIRVLGNEGFLTIKSKVVSLTRSEYEYPIPVADAQAMIDELGDGVISKVRYRIPIGNHVWEVDEFSGENAGLILAEIELSSEDEAFEKPNWVGSEVSGDLRYYNSNLAETPYSVWKDTI